MVVGSGATRLGTTLSLSKFIECRNIKWLWELKHLNTYRPTNLMTYIMYIRKEDGKD